MPPAIHDISRVKTGYGMTGNLLANETSPYLLQHSGNPVDWMPWGRAALQRAEDTNRPILLSVGYAACHWCHVMAHESFEDPETAALMNELFVNVKVDREERPDIDAIYQAALAMLGEHGGWPLTMFLTPRGEPFWGGTYFPPESRFGRPGFRDVLRSVSSVYHSDPERVQHNVCALRGALEDMARPRGGNGFSGALLDEIASRLVGEIDPVNGGTHGAPKFPQAAMLEQLWRAWKRTGDTRYRDAVTTTLTRICQGGIYDHLGGGFARYAVDDRWLVPHFEKMLYDNAQLVSLLTLVWQETRDSVYAARIEETIGWVLREMTHADGGFFSSLDADSEGEEGRFYVWSRAEIETLLGERAERFCRFYDVTAGGNWEGRTILNRLAAPEPGDGETEAALAEDRRVLFEARAERVRPALDDKILADWNGLTIGALVQAGRAFERPEWLAAAARAFAFVCEAMTVDGRLRHSWRDGRANHPATLDDYANMCRAALLLYEATGEADYLARAEGWVALVERHHGDEAGGGYFFAADDTPDLLVRNKTALDNPTPSGNGVMVDVLARLWLLTGRGEYRAAAAAALVAFSGEVTRNFFPLSTLFNSFETLAAPVQIVVIGGPDASDTRALERTAAEASIPSRIVQVVAPGTALPAGHPAAEMTQLDGRATAYVCRGQVCSLPITAAADLASAIGAA